MWWPLGRDGEGKKDEVRMECKGDVKGDGTQLFICVNACHRMVSSRGTGEFKERLNDHSLREL